MSTESEIRLPIEWEVWQEAGYTKRSYLEARILYNDYNGPCPGAIVPLFEDTRDCRGCGSKYHCNNCGRSAGNMYGMHKCPKVGGRSVSLMDPTGEERIKIDTLAQAKLHQELQALADWRDAEVRRVLEKIMTHGSHD